jgi:hypothetical protein
MPAELQCPDNSSFDYRASCWVMWFMGEALGPLTVDDHVRNNLVICTVCTVCTKWIWHTILARTIYVHCVPLS